MADRVTYKLGVIILDLSQAMVKLSCVTDDTCCRVHNTLQSVSDRLRGPGKYSIALVNAAGHECVNK